MTKEFDYLNEDLIDWALSQRVSGRPLGEYEIELLAVVRDHYLPEFEAAIWKLAAENAK